jgi:ribonuclease P protein subunit RPR2
MGSKYYKKQAPSRRNYRPTKSKVRQVAQERMDYLLGQARTMLTVQPEFSKRYVQLARKISTRTKVRLKPLQKQYLCKNCGILLVPGINARVRIRPGKIRIITCLECNTLRRYPFYTRNGK